ncbi:MAG: oligoribonuclease [Acidimicrobiia bacterium]|nr:oligoribonuclease [Acidimicrobiia bacterium]
MLVWMDLEMTGLDHQQDVIVEIATLVTDDDLNIVAEGPDLVIYQPDEVLDKMDPFVAGMHTRSGLLEAIRTSHVTLQDAGAATYEFIRSYAPVPRTVPLCGNSIGTDRRFLAAYLPEIEQHLHYRSVDVSSVKELVKRWYRPVWDERPRKEGTHRALDDIRDSVDELRFYRRHAFVPPVTGVRHVVLFRWVDDATPEQIATVKSALASLPLLIPEISGYRVGADLGLAGDNAQFAVVGDFADEEAWTTYRDHPEHQKIIAELIRPLVAQRWAVQFRSGS